ncbi:hypothetical protein Hdeb2414_s0012g00394911 [Helianthus debilis subsp. tardiflorus]
MMKALLIILLGNSLANVKRFQGFSFQKILSYFESRETKRYSIRISHRLQVYSPPRQHQGGQLQICSTFRSKYSECMDMMKTS